MSQFLLTTICIRLWYTGMEERSKIFAFCFLYTVTFCINKYVLSVLKFQYPTIFQGWQTLFGLILMSVLYGVKKLRIEFSRLNGTALLVWMPYFLVFVVTIYSGSVALSHLPVAIFMSLHNVTTVFHLILDRTVFSNKILNPKEYLMITLIMVSALFISQMDMERSRVQYSWMSLHIAGSTCLVIFPKLSSAIPPLGENCRLYLCYVFSVVLLLPSTLFLGDATSAVDFEFWYYYRFYASCILSGVCGVYLNLIIEEISDKIQTYAVTYLLDISGLAKSLVSVVSLFLFYPTLSIGQMSWCFISLFAGALVIDLQNDPATGMKVSLSDADMLGDNTMDV